MGGPISGVNELHFKPGEILGGKYSVERVLGQGGMGIVLAVRHLALDERRALKVMLPHIVSGPSAVERFFREARSAAKLRSEHVTKVHDVGQLPSGMPFIEMEYLDGSDLAAVLNRSHPLPVGLVAQWMIQVCDALQEAHGLGVVHRDLKPANLFLTKRPNGTDCIKVLDFGIAKLQSAQDASLTSTGAALGSPLYMSPEQMYGARYAEARSDIWSMGIIMFQLLTGQVPFIADSVTAIALMVSNHPTPKPEVMRPDLAVGMQQIILRCLEKQPANRFASVAELAKALTALQLPVVQPSTPALEASFPGMTQLAPAPNSMATAPTALHRSASQPIAAQTDTLEGSISRTTGQPRTKRGRTLLVVGSLAGLVLAGGAGALALKLSASSKTADRGKPAPALADPRPSVTATASVAPNIDPAPPAPPAPPQQFVSNTASTSAPVAAASAPPSATALGKPTATHHRPPAQPPPTPPITVPVIPPATGGFKGVD